MFVVASETIALIYALVPVLACRYLSHIAWIQLRDAAFRILGYRVYKAGLATVYIRQVWPHHIDSIFDPTVPKLQLDCD